ncbi:DUF2254 domain-containing protein [Enterobacteriaceae bacterium 4M9]|nr:DUF2254 domain-containing protein [Enterobacteriaceae bacterium 4M9]
MISRWQWILGQTVRKLWFRTALFALAAVVTALLSIAFKSLIPASVSVKVGAEAVDNILNILASSMLAVTTFSLSIMVAAYGSATTSVTPRATRLVVEDSTTQNVLATFIGTFLFSLVGIVALNMGAYGEQGRVILFVVTLGVIALIVITLLRWIQHLTALGRVGETTARVEKAAQQALLARAQAPYLGGFPWLDSAQQPAGTLALYPQSVGYVEHVDVGKLASALNGSDVHVWLVAQPGCFAHPAQPALYVTPGCTQAQRQHLLAAISISDVRSFYQDPRFCLSVLAEIACRALSAAVNDPGTAIDVIGRAVRVLSQYAGQMPEHADVTYPNVHIAPLSVDNLFDDIFSPIARDGAALREISLRLIKSLSLLEQGWPQLYATAAQRHVQEIMCYIEQENYIDSDRQLLKQTCQRLFPAAQV